MQHFGVVGTNNIIFKRGGMREILKWIIALTLGAFGALVTLAVMLFSFVTQLVMGLLMIMGVVAVGAKGIIDDMEKRKGNGFDNANSPEQRRQSIQFLYDEYVKNYYLEPKAYRRVSATSPEQELCDFYAILPQSVRDDIREIWGKDEMLVHVNTLRTAFGCRKVS